MHIPDGLLSLPVIAACSAAAIPAVVVLTKRAEGSGSEGRAPFLGVLGAFVFAAQMVNFPVGPGISTHLLGGALLTYTAGPAAAVVVMTAVLAIQALVFQDGGVLALGANVFNIALAGVIFSYLPVRLSRSGQPKSLAVFLGATLSVMAAAGLAVGEILVSGISIPTPLLSSGALFFTGGAVLEGVITVAVVRAIERTHPEWIVLPGAVRRSKTLVRSLAIASVFIAAVGLLLASTQPDVLEHLAAKIGGLQPGSSIWATPLADYQWSALGPGLAARLFAAALGLVLAYWVCAAASRLILRRG